MNKLELIISLLLVTYINEYKIIKVICPWYLNISISCLHVYAISDDAFYYMISIFPAL